MEFPDPLEGIQFESIAEKAAYPIIKEISERRGFKFIYQNTVIAQKEHLEGMKCKRDFWGNCSICDAGYEQARIDFVLIKQNRRIAIEIDGKSFHNANVDAIKTDVLRREGYELLRYPASMPLWNPDEFEMWVNYEVRNGSVYAKK